MHYSSLRRVFRQARHLLVLLLVLTLVAIPVGLVFATGTLTLGATMVGNPSSVQTGETVEYIIDFSCGGIIGDCGQLDIDFNLDSELQYLEVIAPPGYLAAETPPGSGIIHIENDPVTNPIFDDGEAAQVTVRAIVGQDLDDFEIDAVVTGEISNGPGGTPQIINVNGPEVPIEVPDGGWTTDKRRTSPGGSLGPIEDGNATYEVELCPAAGALGVARLESVTFQDTFPAGAVVVGNPDGGTVTGNTIEWTLNFPDPNYHTVDDGCVTVSYTLNYPSPPFNYGAPGTDITNNYIITATTPDTPFPNPGTCSVPDCVGSGSEGGTIDPPSVTAGGDKIGPGITAVVAPGNSNGYSTFDLSWNLNNANTSTDDFIYADVFPAAASDGDPIIEVAAFSSGVWGGGYTALVQIATVQNPDPLNDADWITIDTVDGSVNQTYTNGVTAGYPDIATALITGVRWNFTGATVPAGFSGNGMQLQFYVRAGMAPTDYDDGSGHHDYDNCLFFDGDYLDETSTLQPINTNTVCETLRIGEDTTDGFTNIQTSKSSTPTAVFPGQDIQFTLTIDLTQEASGNLINPAIQDVLPYGMQIVSWDSVTMPAAGVTGTGVTTMPYLAVDTVNGTHPVTGAVETVQRLRFYWDDAAFLPAPAITYTCAVFPCTMDTDIDTFALEGVTATTPPGGLNGVSITPPDTGIRTIQIRFTAQARVDTPATDASGAQIDYGNETVVVTDSTNLVCQTGTTGSDGTDADGDSLSAETTCETSSDYNVREAAQMNSQKWIRNTDALAPFTFLDSTNLNNPTPTGCPTYTLGADVYTRYPCVAQGLPGSSFENLLRVQNTGLVNTDEYIMYDILPHIGDTGVSEALEGEQRLTEFRVFLTGPIVYENPMGRADAPTFTFEYYEGAPAYNPCRPQMSQDFAETYGPAGCGAGGWTTTPTWANVTAFRITQSNSGTGYIAPGEELLFTVPMVIDGTPGEAETGEISWNTFAQRFTNFSSDARLLTAEPRKVGIVVEPRYSVGNRVWIDDGAGAAFANGIVDGGELGINGVEVQLWQDTGSGFVLYAIDETRSDAGTGEAGFYFFGNLPGGNGIQYQIRIPGSEFGPGGPLEKYVSSPGETQPAGPNGGNDERDNGIDPVNPANYPIDGVSTGTFRLTANAEFTGETVTNTDGQTFGPLPGSPNDPTDESTTGRGETYEADSNSDLTVDLGFLKPMSIGNRVWLDNGAGGGTADDGIQNGSEAGINNVDVTLYSDTNGNGTFEPGTDTVVDTTTTDATGHYIFDLLPPGDYFVWIDDTNFQGGGALENYDSSPGDDNTDSVDLNDNGIDVNYPATDGIVSAVVNLTHDSEITTETDLGADGNGTNGETADNSDLTVDFGFNIPVFSIGNRVWFDPNNDGQIDPTDTPLPTTGSATPGIPGVTVHLYEDTNGDGNPQAGELVATDITDANGYYLFDDLPEGDYIVVLDENDFRTGGVLVDLYSSNGNGGDTQTDSDDNGIDNPNPEVGGIRSDVIELRKNDEPIGETDLSGDAGDGPDSRGNNGELDSNSELTIDFGLYKPMSIGNRVWFDINDSGTIDGTESGIQNVTVNLYADTDNDGTPDTLIATDSTDVNGYYLFDNLPPGNYYVEIPSSNFTTGNLVGLNSSTGSSGDDSVDSNDNGIDDASPDVNGIRSDIITLAFDSEQINESDLGPENIGANGETDNNSDVTIDFGFVAPVASIGNRVWLDVNDSATIDAADGAVPGIANVAVSLYRDTNTDGIPDGPAIRTDVTDSEGYYLFDRLTPGDYIVGLDNSNFNPGGALTGLISSTGNAGDDQTDLDDNGIDALNATFGLLSETINIARDAEPTGEADLSNDDGDGPPGERRGVNGETDNNSDLTVDFGLHEPLSLGNRVWFDTDDSGDINGTEGGAGGVTVSLYVDDDGDGIPDTPGTPLAVDITNPDGYYLFDGLGEGTYVVVVDNTNFQAGGVLENLSSSTGNSTNNTDSNDNGINPAAAADYLTDGVRSNSVTLTLGNAPINDTDLGPDGAGTNGETNANSDLSIDFGFFGAEMSLGNRVWIDDGAGGGTARDGIRDAGEVTVDGVAVSLYWDSDGDGVPDGPAIATDVTSDGGYYLFDGLAPGSYVVGLDSDNFGNGDVLEGYGSTTTGPADTDDNDNGIDGSSPELNGILSSTVVLERNNEPVGEADISPVDGIGAGGSDANSNLTVDFGLYKSLSIGNRVWFDADDSGLIDNSEMGIAGVAVSLYEDTNGDGIPDGPAIATDVTDSNGYYLFDGLEPGDYIVGVDNSNFNPTNALDGFASSTGDVNDITDSNDNGIDVLDATYGILSDTVTLTRDGTPTNEADTSGDALNDGPNFRGTNAESDNNSDLTVDFGFVADVMSLGNRVWLDDGSGGGGNNNGVQDGTEPGIEDVIVNLYADTDSDGVPDDAALATDTTDANGYYLFDGLAPGHYVVQIVPTNFQSGGPLSGYLSSTGNNLATVDLDDNGIDSAAPASTGIFSQSIHLIANNAPVGETDLSGDAGDGPDSRGNNGETDDNSDLTIDFGFVVQYDWGDAPDSYGTTAGSNGPSHQIVPDLFLGQRIDDETSGADSVGADGDNTAGTDDEDGVNIPPLVAGTTVDIEVTVFNNTGSDATLVGWIDFDGNGTFEPGEAVTVTVPSSPTEQVIQVPVIVPLTADVDTGGTTYARWRLTTDSSIDDTTPTGPAADGEVEDYVVTVLQPGVSITKSDSLNSMQPGDTTTYTITITNSGTAVVNGWVVDAIPIADPDGFDPATITWTCVASNGASCIHGDPAGTPANGTGQIDERVDLPRSGRLVYQITATLRDTYSQDFVTNEASIDDPANPGPVADDDTNGIITDPPYGLKTGAVRHGNIIRWTLTWYNTGPLQPATVTDTIRRGQTFNGNLVCNVYGTSSTTTCEENGGVVTWTGQIGTGDPNRVEISFDVLVRGNGIYRNTSAMTLGAGAAAAGGSSGTIAGRVRIGSSGGSGGGDDDDDEDVTAVVTAVPPEIILSKSVNPPFAQPGDVVEWVITASNVGTVGATSITITDSVPGELEILSASASYGTPTVSGQQVSLFIAWLGPGQSVTITLQTRIRSDVAVPFTIVNLAFVQDLTATAQVISIESLPNTGESPWSGWQIIFFSVVIVGVSLTGFVMTRRRYRHS